MIPVLMIAAAQYQLSPEMAAAEVDGRQVVGDCADVREFEVRLGDALAAAG